MSTHKSARRCAVYFQDTYAGILEQTKEGYRFTYDERYRRGGTPIGFGYPTSKRAFDFQGLPALFDNLVSEGWMRRTQSVTQKISESDRFGLLIENGSDLIGAITVKGTSMN